VKHPWDTVVWWEIRRIPYNLILLAVGIVSLFVVGTLESHLVKSGEDEFEPSLGIVFYALTANLFYTVGWMAELSGFWGSAARAARIRPKVFRLGLTFSAVLTLLPAILFTVIWAAHGFP
jgi:hypothetical protein